jgi:hypothetical protein
MSVESSHLAKHSDIGGWSDNISHRTYQKLVDFFKQRQPIHIEGSEICMYNKNVATRSPETCWDEDSMKEHMNYLEEHGEGWWLHLDKEIENVKPSTFRVRNRESLFLLDTAYVGQAALRALLGHLVRQGNARNVIAQAYTSYTMVRHRTSWRAVASASAKKMP